MTDSVSLGAVVDELRLLRQQQWDMHATTMGKLDVLTARVDGMAVAQAETNVRLDQTVKRLDQTVERLDQTVERLDQTVERLDRLERYTENGFAQTVGQINKMTLAFERFVTLSLEERRRIWPEIDGLKARVDALERKNEPGSPTD